MRSREAEELWRRFGAGDGSAFSQLYSEHHHDVVRYCRSLLRDDEDAQDAAQGTWAALWTTPDAARRDVPLRPWLFRVAHNEAISIIRRRRPHEPLADLELPAAGDVADDVEVRDRLATLRADLVNLPERQRVALLSRELGGLGHAEIGEALGISAAAAKQTIYEARRALVEAERGRSMACDHVQRAISDGDGRVRRSRRLGAHLRGCASCQTFADAVGRRRRDLRLLFPTPAALGLLARTAIGTGAAAGGAAGGGAVATKVAVTAAVIAVAGVGGHHELARVGGASAKAAAPIAHAASTPPRREVATAPVRPAAQRTIANTTVSTPPHHEPRTTVRHHPSAGPKAGAPAVRAKPVAPRPAPLGRAKKGAGAAVPPGRAKKAAGAPGPAGRTKKTDGAAVPPGRAKKADGAPVPAGRAKKTDGAAVPPGRAKRPAGTAAPPGHVKKTDTEVAPPAASAGAPSPSPALPPGQAKRLAQSEPSAP